LRDAAAGWQFRAIRAEERLAQLEAGPLAGVTETPEAAYAPVDATEAPQHVDPVHMASEPLRGAYGESVPAQVSLATGWRRWWRRVMGHEG
jgi:hypothetical protein